MKKITSLILTICMLAALLAPLSVLPASAASESLEIVRASDNGGTTATSTAREAIAGLGSGTSWYSANRNNLTGKISKAVYTLKQSAFVDGVEIAFYYADQRTFQFSIEYSMDKEIWETAFEKTWSTQQEADKTAEYFEFPEQVEALYLQVTIYDAKIVDTGVSSNTGAFYSFEAFGEFDPEGIIDPGTVAPEGQVWADKATQTEGSLHTNAIYHPNAACPNLRTLEGVWFSANASGSSKIAAVYMFNQEVDLNEIQLDWYKGDQGRNYEYALYLSTNDRDWVEVVSPGTVSDGATDSIKCNGSAVYVKIVSEDGWVSGGGTANNWIALEEIRFYGDYVEDDKEPGVEIQTGTTGDCTWTLDANGVLTISGEGKMKDFYEPSSFPWGDEVTSVVIEDGVTRVGSYAFYRSKKLTSVILGKDVKEIGTAAFKSCHILESVILPDNLETLGSEAFYSCEKLKTTITLPSSLKFMGSQAFTYSGVEHIEIKNGLENIPDNGFYGCEKLISIKIPNSVKTIGHGAFALCRQLKAITIPAQVPMIEEWLFADCRELNKIIFLGNPSFFGEGLISYKKGEDIIFYGFPGGSAEEYANGKSSVTFVPLIEGTVSASVVGNGEVNAFVDDEEITNISAIEALNINTVTLTAIGEGFKFWKNAKNGAVLSSDAVLTVPGGRDMEIVAVFEEEEAETYTVYFKDSKTGKIHKVMEVAAGTKLIASDLPSVSCKGYSFKGWKIGALDAEGYVVNKTVVVNTSYERDSSSTVPVTIIWGNKRAVTNRSFGEVIAVTATVENFSYWMLNGKIVSTDRNYRFNAPATACRLEAVCGATDAPAAVAAKVDLTKDGQTFYYLMSRSVAEGNTILETGVLMSRKATAADLVIDTTVNTVTRGYSTAGDEYDVVGFQKDATGKTGTWLVRGYVTYQTAKGTVDTVYTDVSNIVID